MNNPLDPTLRELNDCGCCAGTTAETPSALENRPGLDAIAFRAGTHPKFKASLLAVLTAARNPALRNLKTRDDDDLTIALLDGWATVADVLTFYAERIANESYLRTATERRSVIELARSIGYELNPGVAASTSLAFTIEDAPGAPGFATIEAGTKIQSIPGPDETPQVFETLQPLLARKEWNRLYPESRAFVLPQAGMERIHLQGTTTNLKAGDALVFIGEERERGPTSKSWDVRRVKELETFPSAELEDAYSIVTLDRPLGAFPAPMPKVFALRQRAALYGANAPAWQSLSDDVQDKLGPAGATNWADLTISGVSGGSDRIINLDAVYPAIVPESWIVLSRPGQKMLYQVKSVGEDSPAKFTLTAKSTRLTLEGDGLSKFNNGVRETVVFAQSEELEWAKVPLTSSLSGKTIVLDRILEPDLPAGRALIIQSELPLEQGGGLVAEVALLKKTEPVDATRTRLILEADLTKAHPVATAVIFGNVAFSTHGETTHEVLGSGDANQAHQRFLLKQAPLTYIPAAHPSGGESTLEVWVDDVRWREVRSLFNAGPRERVYVVRIADAADGGKATVLFGDGRSGARLPSGHENIRAVYRYGIGREGLLKPGQLSLLLTQPLGVKEVTNPEATKGAVDPQLFADARRNAPTTVLTLDRVVSLKDYEDFAANFSGVAKALATWTWNVNSRGIFLTVAGLAGAGVDPESSLRHDLIESLRELGNPLLPVEVRSFLPVKFKLAGTVFIHADRLPEKVEKAVKDALKAAFSFEARSFGQPVALSEVEAVIQNVAGVAFVDLDALHRGSTGGREGYLPAHKPDEGAAIGSVSPAELLMLDQESLSALKVKTV